MAAPASAEIAFVLPLYDKYLIGRWAALSFFKYTERPALLIVVDDASPHYPDQDWDAWKADMPEDRLLFKYFSRNAGLTRSWNWGLQQAKELGVKYAIAGNSDVLFTPGWEHSLIHQVEDGGYSLIGPITNAPGFTNGGRQRVENYYPKYRLTDDADYLRQVAEYCRENYPTQAVECAINGFFMLAKTDRWWEGAFNETYVFDPAKAMTGNEDELQRRWHARGFRTGFAPGSVIFHYRAYSRGDRFKHKGWFRPTNMNREI